MTLFPKVAALAGLALLSSVSISAAQQSPAPGTAPPDAPLTQIPEVPAPGPDSSEPPAPDASPMGDPCAAQPGGAGAGQDLSGKLADCSDVLTPPATNDPEIQAPAPDPTPGTTPVIPPNSVPDQPQAK